MRKLGIRYQRIAFVLLAIVAAVSAPYFGDTGAGDAIYAAGLICVLISVAGRWWCTLHIGSHKGRRLVVSGPYSLVRNPLYLFSTLAAAGFGLLHGSLIITCGAVISTIIIFLKDISGEEAELSRLFGGEYRAYMQKVPRLLPSVPSGAVSFRFLPRHLNFSANLPSLFDTAYILLLIPFVEGLHFARAHFDLQLWRLV